MKIGILGSGDVAQTLASGFLKHRHAVMLGTRDPAKLAEWKTANPTAQTGSFAEAADFGEVLVLAVKGTVASDVLKMVGAENLGSKLLMDATNPIADAPPVNGVFTLSTKANESQMERLQREFPTVRFVKVFNSVGSALMVNPEFKDGTPTMFICGNDDSAKRTVTGILDQFGWETADMGKVESARAIEALCVLWCLPGLLRNEWSHAFKLLKST